MKVTNIETLRNELEKNLTDIFFNAVVRQLSDARFPKHEDPEKVTHLVNPIQFQKEVWDGSGFKVTDEYYITLSDDSVYFWKSEPDSKCFKFLHCMDFNMYRTKTLFMMGVAVEVEDLLQ